MGWRDEATLAAIALIHEAAACAMAMLEDRINAIVVLDPMTGADAAARDIFRPLMRQEVGAAADDWFKTHAVALRQVDARLETLALRFAAMGERPTLPQDEVATPATWGAPTWLRGSVDTIGSTIDRAAAEVVNHAVPNVVRERAKQVSALIAREIGERSGAHQRLRTAAQGEISRVWLGPVPGDLEPRSYLALLLEIIDRTTGQAMEIIA